MQNIFRQFCRVVETSHPARTAFQGRILSINKHFSRFYCTPRNEFRVVRLNCNLKPYDAILGRHALLSKFGLHTVFRSSHAVAQTKLTSLNTPKKRAPRVKVNADQSNSVTAFATAEGYDLDLLREGLKKSEFLYIPSDVTNDYERPDVIFAEAPWSDGGEPKQIFFFAQGAVVFWNVPAGESQEILRFIEPYERSRYNDALVQHEQEIMPYSYKSNKKTDLVNGQIVLESEKKNIQNILDKYTFSNALMLSVKLGIWEGTLENYIVSLEAVTEDLKLGNTIRVSRKEVLQKTGELFSLRHSVNLSSDALDIPDFYWDREELENIYLKMFNYLSINRRTKVVNDRIGHCLELLELVSSHLNDNHHVRLEWMIIVLIMVEVGFEFMHYISH